MRKNIFYICGYDDYLNNRELITQPSCVTKSDYIIQTLIEAGFNVKVFSVASSMTKKVILKSASRKVNSNLQIYYINNLRKTNIILKVVATLFIYLQVLIFLLKREKEDIVLVYHSKRLSRVIFYISKIKRIRLYFEIEEIYSAVFKRSNKEITKEIRTLSRSKGNIVVNDIIHEKLNNKVMNIPCYGIYKHNAKPKLIDKSKPINIVYAGLIGDCYSDAFLAVKTAPYLNSNYSIHILGFGSNDNISNLKKEIENLPNGSCSVFYHGCMHGKEYSSFLSKCHIGLCIRTLPNIYSDYTFPSKIFAYLSNNIIPICSDIDCVKKSKIANEIYFTSDITPASVAKTILAIDINIIDYERPLTELHKNFVNEIKYLFK